MNKLFNFLYLKCLFRFLKKKIPRAFIRLKNIYSTINKMKSGLKDLSSFGIRLSSAFEQNQIKTCDKATPKIF